MTENEAPAPEPGRCSPAVLDASGGQGARGHGPTDGEAVMFGQYRLVELLGRGGTGEVWRAFDTHRERTVALKRLTGSWAGDATFRARFRLEARTTARLSSEHVVPIHDYGEIDDHLFIDMRLISGGDLAALLAAHPRGLPPVLAVDLCSQIADGLDAAHREHLIHRDVKPSNVLLAPDRGGLRAYLVDFGLVKAADEVTGAGLTATGATLGTVAYMAPELYYADGRSGPAGDVYALGCVLFEMLTGRRVFSSVSTAALAAQHLHETPTPVSALRPDLAAFDVVVARALEKDPERRPSGAAALAAEAAAVLGRLSTTPGTVGGPPTPPGRPPEAPTVVDPSGGPGRRRHRGRRLLALVAVLLVLAGLTTGGAILAHRWHTPPAAAAPPPTPSGPLVPGQAQRLAVPVQGVNSVAFSPDGRRAYVANGSTLTVTVVDTATNTAVATVPVPAAPGWVAVSPDGRRAYVTGWGGDQTPGTTVTVLDTTRNAVTATVPVDSEPLGVVVSPDGTRAYVSIAGSNATVGHTVDILDTTTNTVIGRVEVGAGPGIPGISPDGTRLYVPDWGPTSTVGTTVAAADLASGAASTLSSAAPAPWRAIVSPDGGRVYLVCGGSTTAPGGIQVLDAEHGTVTPLRGSEQLPSPGDGALSADGRTLVVAEAGPDNAPGSTVSVIDTVTGTERTVPLGGRPYRVAITPDRSAAWVSTNAPNDALWRIPLTRG